MSKTVMQDRRFQVKVTLPLVLLAFRRMGCHIPLYLFGVGLEPEKQLVLFD